MPPRARATRAMTSARARRAERSKNRGFFTRHRSVFLYVPNLIGYGRLLACALAMARAFTSVNAFTMLYALSFACDAIDGACARAFEQSSTFGAALDMITDRVATTALLTTLACADERFRLSAIALIALDVSSHWMHDRAMTTLGKTSHKDVGGTRYGWITRYYYESRLFMGACCVGAEVMYVSLHVLAIDPTERTRTWVWVISGGTATFARLARLAAPLWAVKQWTNVSQLVSACRILAASDVVET